MPAWPGLCRGLRKLPLLKWVRLEPLGWGLSGGGLSGGVEANYVAAKDVYAGEGGYAWAEGLVPP